MPNQIVDYYWSFRSHYCYLSIGRVTEIDRRYPVDIRLRPVLPMVVRNPDLFASIPKTGPNRWAYIQRDAERIARRLGLPFGWPDPDPVVMDHNTYKAAPAQPHITRLNRLAVLADQNGQGLTFAATVSRVIFGGVTGWDQEGRLETALGDAGFDVRDMEAQISAQASQLDKQIEANGDALFAAGHWGVPTLVFRGEPFFGQDRLEDFCWQLEQEGLQPV